MCVSRFCAFFFRGFGKARVSYAYNGILLMDWGLCLPHPTRKRKTSIAETLEEQYRILLKELCLPKRIWWEPPKKKQYLLLIISILSSSSGHSDLYKVKSQKKKTNLWKKTQIKRQIIGIIWKIKSTMKGKLTLCSSTPHFEFNLIHDLG